MQLPITRKIPLMINTKPIIMTQIKSGAALIKEPPTLLRGRVAEEKLFTSLFLTN